MYRVLNHGDEFCDEFLSKCVDVDENLSGSIDTTLLDKIPSSPIKPTNSKKAVGEEPQEEFKKLKQNKKRKN